MQSYAVNRIKAQLWICVNEFDQGIGDIGLENVFTSTLRQLLSPLQTAVAGSPTNPNISKPLTESFQ